MSKPRTNHTKRLSENQIRNDERQKVGAEIALKLCPPFSQDYFATEILGYKSRQVLNNHIRKYFKKGESK